MNPWLYIKGKTELRNASVSKFVYFLPNHDFEWIDNLLTALKTRDSSKYNLLIVGYYYGAIAKSIFPKLRVSVIDNNPLGILSNAFAVWLNLHKKLESKKISRILFAEFYRTNSRHRTLRVKLSKHRYQYSLGFFREFFGGGLSGRKKESIEYLFRTIYQIKSDRDCLILDRIPKGFSSEILNYPLNLEPDKIIVKNFLELSNRNKYNIIITSNLIDFIKDKNKFLEKAQSLLLKGGRVEISSYNKRTNEMLGYLYKNKQSFLGTGTFFKQIKNYFTYIKRPIYLDKITHILQPNNS